MLCSQLANIFPVRATKRDTLAGAILAPNLIIVLIGPTPARNRAAQYGRAN